MPEFRFRRKKKKQQSSRRHTVHDPEETHATVAAAREMVKREEQTIVIRTRSPSISDPSDIPAAMAMTSEGGHMVSTGTLAREREKFFDLLRTKYPEHGEGIEEFLSSEDTGSDKQRSRHYRSQRSQSADLLLMHTSGSGEGGEEEEEEERGRETEGGQIGRRERGWSEREGERTSLSSSDAKEMSSEPETSQHHHYHYGGCFFLRHGKELRRCPIPSPITLSTLKNLLVNTFDLQTSLLEDPMSYVMIQDRGSVRWKPLTDISDIYDHCILQLANPDTPLTNPTHFLPEAMLNDHTHHSSSESPPFTNHPTPQLAVHHYNHTSAHITTPPHTSQPTTDNRVHSHTENSSGSSCIDKSFNSMWQSDNTEALPLSPHHPPSLNPHNTTTTTTTTTTNMQYGSPHSVTSSTSGVCSEPLQISWSSHKINRQVKVVQHHVQELRRDYETYRKEQLSEIADFSLCLKSTTHNIVAAIRGHTRAAMLGDGGVSVEHFRRQRMELTAEKEAYNKCSSETMLEVSILETAVDDIRRDVVDRRCRVHEKEANGLIDAVQMTIRALNHNKAHYLPLESKMRRVMEQELTNIVEEERFLQDESPRLKDVGEKCQTLAATLETLKHVAAVQFHRTPLVPYFHSVPNPDRQALMENIRAVTPNHTHRVESIEMAKCVQHKKKELIQSSERIKQFESQLRIQKNHLHKMDSVMSQHEDRQAKKVIALYLEEKAQREEELAKEMKLERKVAERKRKEERECVKERLRQKEDEKKKTRMEQLRSRVDNDQSSQSLTGEESSGEWYSGGGDNDSLRFSSSFSSTASLLEHVRNVSGWSSVDTTLQNNNSKKEEKQKSGAKQKDLNTKTKLDESKQLNDDVVQSHLKSSESETHSVVTRGTVDSKSVQSNQRHKKDEGNKSLKTPAPKSHQKKALHDQQQETHQNKHGSQKKGKSLQRGSHVKRKPESSQHKNDSRQHVQLNNEQVRTKSQIQSAPTTGLHALFKANKTGISQETPPKHTNQSASNSHIPKNTVQSTKQPASEPERKIILRKKRVPLNDTKAPPAARRVSSSDALLEDSHSHHNNRKPATIQPVPASTRLADAPPNMRKSIGYIGKLDDQAGVYDLLAKKVKPPSNPQPREKKDSRLQMGFQTPTFDPATRQEGVQQQQQQQSSDTVSRSQPDNFDFSSNPSYESGTAAKYNIAKSSSGNGMTRSTDKKTNQNVPVNNPRFQLQSHMHQSYMPHNTNQKTNNTAITRQLHAQTSQMGKPVVKQVHPVSRHEFSSVWQQYESDSSETERIKSVLSDQSSTHLSTMSTVSAKNSSSSSHSDSQHHHHHRSQIISQMLQPPHLDNHIMYPSRVDDSTHHSRLPAPRKRYHSQPHDQPEILNTCGYRQVIPHPPPHRQTTRIPLQSGHDDGALTSYPRFQRREDHQARLKGTPTARRHRTKQLGVLPGTGQLAQFTKQVTENHIAHGNHHSNRQPNVGSLV